MQNLLKTFTCLSDCLHAMAGRVKSSSELSPKQIVEQFISIVNEKIQENSFPADLAAVSVSLCKVVERLFLADDDINQSETSLFVGLGWAYLGLFHVQILATQQPVDPAQKQQIKLNYIREEVYIFFVYFYHVYVDFYIHVKVLYFLLILECCFHIYKSWFRCFINVRNITHLNLSNWHPLQIEEIRTELKVYNLQHYLETGLHLSRDGSELSTQRGQEANNVDESGITMLDVKDSNHSWLPGGSAAEQSNPHVKYLLRRLTELQEKVSMLSKMVAVRPDPSQYELIVQDLKHYLQAIGSVRTVTALLEKLKIVWRNLKDKTKLVIS